MFYRKCITFLTVFQFPAANASHFPTVCIHSKLATPISNRVYNYFFIIGIKTGYITPEDWKALARGINSQKTQLSLYFKNERLEKILEEWVTVDSITIQDAGVKEKLLRLWKEEVLSTARSRKSKWNFRNEEDGLHLYRYIMSMFDKRQAILERGLGNIWYNSVTKEGIKLAEKCVQKCSVFTGWILWCC